MTVRAVDPGRSRVVLVGTPAYRDPLLADVPVVASNVRDLAAVLTDPQLGGFDAAHCVTTPFNASVAQVGDLLVRAARQAEDLLLFYYSGHGLLSMRRHELYLSLAGTLREQLAFTALPFEAVREACLESRAASRVVILDSCYSGRAIGETLADGDQSALEQLDIAGTYTLTSAPANRAALILPGEAHTAFTERLLCLLREGSPEAGPMLSLGDIYRTLHARMRAEGLPLPQQCGTATADMLGVVRNQGAPHVTTVTPPFSPPAPPPKPPPTPQPSRPALWWSPASHRPRERLLRPHPLLWILGGIVALFVSAVIVNSAVQSILSPPPKPPKPTNLVAFYPASRYGVHNFGLITVSASAVWATAGPDNAVLEINEQTGGLIRKISGGNFGFNDPSDITSDGTHLWVTNYKGDSLTEIDQRTGSWIRTLSGGQYHFRYPARVWTYDNKILAVTNWMTPGAGLEHPAPATITLISASDGRFLRILSSPGYRFYTPFELLAIQGHGFIISAGGPPGSDGEAGGSVTEVNASDYNVIHVTPLNVPPHTLDDSGYWAADASGNQMVPVGFDGLVAGFSSFGFDLPAYEDWTSNYYYVPNYLGNSVTEMSSDGSVQATFSAAGYFFNHPDEIQIVKAGKGFHAWVVSAGDGNGHGASLAVLSVQLR